MPPRKRARQRQASFGARTEDDNAQADLQLGDPTDSVVNHRKPPGKPIDVPTLVTLACRSFATNLATTFPATLWNTPNVAPSLSKSHKRAIRQLQILPDHLNKRVWRALVAEHPGKLSGPFLRHYFLRGDTVELSGSLPGVSKSTLHDVARLGNGGELRLTAMALTGLTSVRDDDFALAVKAFPGLEKLVLR